MKKLILIFLLNIGLFILARAQMVYTFQTDSKKEFDNIYSEKIYSDSLSSSFVITIRKSVGLHKHDLHTEHVYILEGSGEMQLGKDHLSVVKGDLVIIPKGTPHSLEVTSIESMRILSIQSPEYDGDDIISLD